MRHVNRASKELIVNFKVLDSEHVVRQRVVEGATGHAMELVSLICDYDSFAEAGSADLVSDVERELGQFGYFEVVVLVGLVVAPRPRIVASSVLVQIQLFDDSVTLVYLSGCQAFDLAMFFRKELANPFECRRINIKAVAIQIKRIILTTDHIFIKSDVV